MVIIGNTDVVKFQNFRWWAERGLVNWENMDTGEYGTISVRQCLQRLKALNDMVGTTRAKGLARYADQVAIYQNYIEDMVQLCAKAQEQGDPTDAKVATEKAEMRKIANRSRLVVVPGLASTF